MIGGYQILDINANIEPGGSGVKVEGIYSKILDSKKMVIVKGLKVNGVSFSPSPVVFDTSESGLTGLFVIREEGGERIGTYMTVNAEDVVTLAQYSFNGGGGVTPKKYTVKLIAGDQETTETLYAKYGIFRIGYGNFESEGTYYTDVSVQGDYGDGGGATMQMNINITSSEAYIPFNKVTFARAGVTLLEKDISVGGTFIGLERVELDPDIDDGKIITITFTNV